MIGIGTFPSVNAGVFEIDDHVYPVFWSEDTSIVQAMYELTRTTISSIDQLVGQRPTPVISYRGVESFVLFSLHARPEVSEVFHSIQYSALRAFPVSNFLEHRRRETYPAEDSAKTAITLLSRFYLLE